MGRIFFFLIFELKYHTHTYNVCMQLKKCSQIGHTYVTGMQMKK